MKKTPHQKSWQDNNKINKTPQEKDRLKILLVKVDYTELKPSKFKHTSDKMKNKPIISQVGKFNNFF